MKKKLFSILFALVLVLSFSLVTAVPVAADTIDVPSDYTTIQEAIDAAGEGDTINVAAGTYDGFNVDRSLTLLGAQANVEPIFGGRSDGESIVQGAISITASDVVVNGFEIPDQDHSISVPAKDVVDQVDRSNIAILYNYIHSSNGRYGIVLMVDVPAVTLTYSDIEISHNYIWLDHASYASPGIRIGGGDGGLYTYNGLEITGNEIAHSPAYGIFAGGTPSECSLNDAVISNNNFHDCDGGMNIGNGGNVIICDNWFHDMTSGDAIGFQVSIVGGSVTNNTFEDNASNAFELWGDEYGCVVSTDVTISGNTIKFNNQSIADEHGIRLRSGADAPNIHINFNDFIDGGVSTTALAVRNEGTGVADATNNWWGTTDETEIAAMVSGDVDYTPPLDSPVGTSSGAVGMTASYTPTVGISIDTTFVNFGSLTPDQPVTETVTVTNVGTGPADFDANIIHEDPVGIYTATGEYGLRIDNALVSAWGPEGVAPGSSPEGAPTELSLTVPITAPPGRYNAVLIFWATPALGD